MSFLWAHLSSLCETYRSRGICPSTLTSCGNKEAKYGNRPKRARKPLKLCAHMTMSDAKKKVPLGVNETLDP